MQPAVRQPPVTNVVSAGTGLCAFAVAVLAGVAVNNPADVILIRALVALVGGYFVGLFVGLAAQFAVHSAANEFRVKNPAPMLGKTDPAGAEPIEVGTIEESQAAEAA